MVENLPAMWETQVQSLDWEDPLEKEMAAAAVSCFSLQYSCLENSMDSEAWQATVYEVAKSWT